MNIDRFIYKYRGHSDACWTVHWFLNGKVGLQEALHVAMLIHSGRIRENVIRYNPLYEMLNKRKVV